MSKKILITGACGFIGHHLVEGVLKETDWEIVILDALTYAGNLNRLTDISIWEQEKHRVKFIWHDLKSPIPETTHKIIGDFDYIWHLAAESIPENIYVPIQSTPDVGTRMITFAELWEQQSKRNKIQKTENGEAIFLRGHQVKVLSFLNGGQWMPIKAITRHWYEGEIVKLKQKWGVIEATPNHSIYSANLELTNPDKNPELLVVRDVNERRKKYKNKRLSLLEVLAAYITEGNATFNEANGSYIVEIGQNNKKWLENIGELIKSEFGLNYCIIKRKKESGFSLQVSNKEFFEYLIKNCGKYCDGKFFPNWIFDLDPNHREFFWQKLLEGDGTTDGRYTTTSYKLANQLSLLLALQGKDFRVYERNPEKDKASWEFKTELSGQHQGLVQRKKKIIDYKGWVYDIEVKETHNFVCGIGNVVCHNSHVDRSLQDSIPFVMSNVVGTANLLEYVRKRQPNLKKFLNFSTDEIFGPAPEGVYFKEGDVCNPSNPYSASKEGQEAISKAFAFSFGLPVIISRSMNIFAERQNPEKFIPKTVRAILNDEKVIIHGIPPKVSSRCWIHARNVGDALLFLMEKGEVIRKEKQFDPQHGIYHIVGEERDVLYLANRISEIIRGRKLNGREIEYIDFHSVRPGHDLRYALSGEKMKKIGWKPKLSLDQSFEKMIKWMIRPENQKWLNL